MVAMHVESYTILYVKATMAFMLTSYEVPGTDTSIRIRLKVVATPATDPC